MMSLQDVFISYGRADSKSFAQQLNDRLSQAKLAVWFDFDDIPFGVDYQDEIDEGIGNADNFLFLISPHAVNSAYCAKEVNLALAYNKRIIPLMHVEQISRETWQQRHPNGTDEEWQVYQEKGSHSSFPNLHPAIGRINWIFFREGIDDFETSFAHLLELLQQHQSYVRLHTQYLSQSLEWDRNQRQETFLLTEAEGIELAKTWLQTRFTETLPPCLPTILHSEFITESIKQHDQGMTDVFLSYSEEDRAIQEQVRVALARRGFTVWTNTTDIRTGVDFQAAIHSGIEKADTIVILLSPHSVASTYCQDELTYGQTYNKRIIPVLITPMDVGALPPLFQSTQFIDGTGKDEAGAKLITSDTDNTATNNNRLQRAIAQLIRALNDNADYYAQHKWLLVKALAWDRRDRPNDIVLRGQEFVTAEAWLAISQQTTTLTHPTRLHQAFITASADQNRFFDAFISYGRADSLEFARQLYEHLVAAGLNVWFDQEDIPVGVDFQAQIDDGIERSHNFLFVIAPHSVHSPYCLKEIELAVQCNKRIIPLMHVEEVSYETWQDRFPDKSLLDWEEHKTKGKHSSFTAIHPEIGKINWIFFREGRDNFDQSLIQLTQLIHQHEQYVRQHTDLLTKALAWKQHNYEDSYLLTGEHRKTARQWLTQDFQNEQAPCRPTLLQGEFICESVEYANNSMTNVFLCYAEGDGDLQEMIHQSSHGFRGDIKYFASFPSKIIHYHLMLAGLTVWDYMTDIQSGEALQDAIYRGIETADSFIFILSEATIHSSDCQRALIYATQLNKRIIPVIIGDIPEKIPKLLKQLQTIDVSNEIDVQKQIENKWISEGGIQLLIQALRQDAAYYQTHKRLLAIALKWDRQQQNPTILLRGNTLKQYSSWLQLAEKRPQNPPTNLQRQFVTESSQQPPLLTVDVFMIYAPADYEFVQWLNDTLQIQNKRTWFDETIVDGSIQDVEVIDSDQLENGIDQAENIIFVISPDSIKASRCIQELQYAHQHNKRIIPVLYREVLSAKRPDILNDIPWLDFQPKGDFLTQFGTLYRKLESDPSHIRPHTLLMVRSQEWDDSERDDSYLLRGRELQSAEAWLQQSEAKTPAPNELQREYIAASRTLPFRKLKKRSVVLTGIASTIVVFGIRLAGLLQPLELWTYDIALNHKPSEPQDDRFLMVKVDDESGRWLREEMNNGNYTPSIGTIPEEALAQAINNLQSFNPSLIGLDFYRDYKAEPGMAELLVNTDNLISLCKAEDSTENAVGHRAPDEVPIERVGFNDLVTEQNNVLRRHLIKNNANSELCSPENSFSFLLAQRYLEANGLATEYVDPFDEDGNPVRDMVLGGNVIPQLYSNNASGYFNFFAPNQLGGYQVLANFRLSDGSPEQFASSVSLRSVIEGNLAAEQVRDRIIIIGYFDESDRNADFYNTPHGRVAGAIIQGQLASQLISKVSDGRSLIWWWSPEAEFIWILGWSLAGGFILWGVVRPIRLTIALSAATIGLYLSCTLVMIAMSGWIPFIPAFLAAGITAVVIAIRNHQLRHP